MKRKSFLKSIMIGLSFALVATVCSCADKPSASNSSASDPTSGESGSTSGSPNITEKPYLVGESTAKYANEPRTFEFELNGYQLSVSAEHLQAEDYSIEGGMLTLFTDFFERENKKEYTIAYSLKLVEGNVVLDEKAGVLNITAEKWSDITWH